MDCWIHPLPYDSELGYYPCCGRISNQKKYWNYNEIVEGCTKVDHVSSYEELEDVKSRGYGTVPFRYAHYVKVLGVYKRGRIWENVKEEQKIIPITKQDDLEQELRFYTFYDNDVLDLQAISSQVDNGEYDLKVIEDSDEDSEVEDDSVTNYFHYSHRAVTWEQEQEFMKFFIVRRMEYTPSSSRIERAKNESGKNNRLKRRFDSDSSIKVS